VRRFRWTAILTVVALASVGSATAAVAASSGGRAAAGPPPTATEVGVTSSEIHIAVVADVDNTLQPGLFRGSVAGVRSFASYINSLGGIGGRKVVVDFIDSHLSNSEARNAVIRACSQDFALVGTSALFLNNVDDLLACKDQSGQTTGLPDIPVVATEIVQQCSPTSFPINPPQIVCGTRAQHPQQYQANAGRYFYYAKKFGKSLHGVYLYTGDLKSAHDANQVTGTALQNLGVKADLATSISALAPQSGYTPAAQSMKSKGSNFAEVELAYSQTVDLRKEAALQGVTDPKILWSCTVQCYAPQFLSQGGASVEGQHISLGFLPFEEPKANKAVAAFDKYTPADQRDGFAADGFAAGLALRDAANAVVKQSGTNGLTRKALLSALNNLTAFNGDGMFGTTNIGGRVPSDCYMIVQVKNGKYVREFPTKPGTLDCTKRNVVNFKLDLGTG
jgi:ABC-type branched-subunit amino acid transport system substrate-binding protein